jgi:hypothetical protein
VVQVSAFLDAYPRPAKRAEGRFFGRELFAVDDVFVSYLHPAVHVQAQEQDAVPFPGALAYQPYQARYSLGEYIWLQGTVEAAIFSPFGIALRSPTFGLSAAPISFLLICHVAPPG